MPKYTGIQVPQDAEVIGRTNRRLKLPFIKPRTDHEHDANARKLEQWGNQLPFTPPSEGDGGYRYAILQVVNGRANDLFVSHETYEGGGVVVISHGVSSPDLEPPTSVWMISA